MELVSMMLTKAQISKRITAAGCVTALLAIVIGILLTLPALAALPSTDASWKAPDVDAKQTLAIYSGGGKVTVEQAIAWAKEWTGTARRVYMFPYPEQMYEKAARSVAIERIALAKFEELKLAEKPGWKIAEKLIESKALMSLFYDDKWTGYNPTQQEKDEFAKENPQMALMPRPTGGPEASLADAYPDYQRPNKPDWLIWQLRGQHSAKIMGEFFEEAARKYPIDCVEHDKWEAANDDDVLFKVAKISLTAKDIKDLSEIAGHKFESCWNILQLGDHGEPLIMLGELAREKGYANRDEFPEALKAAKKEWIVATMKARMVEDLLTEFVPSEQAIQDYYDNEWKGMQDQIMKCDFIVCPVDYSDPSSSASAKALAAELIMKLQQGAKFDDLLKEYPECRYQSPTERHVQPEYSGGFNSPAIAGTAVGDVALDSVEDYGGHCVIRVLENKPPAKTPLEYCRGACIGELEFRHKNQTTGDVDGSILNKYNFAIQKSVMSQLTKEKS
jgi:hypothetical protein